MKLEEANRQKVIDVLTERLAFERAGVQLYDSIIAKMEEAPDGEIKKMMPEMQAHREHERQHQAWLEGKIRALGGDPDRDTEYSRLVKRESQGIEDVILDGDGSIPHLFHALLSAELTDNAGWEMLVDLAAEAGDEEARAVFNRYLNEEEDHLELCMRAVEAFQRHEVLGEPLEMPRRD